MAVAKSGIECETNEDVHQNGLVKLVVTPEQAISVRLPTGEDRVIPFDPSATLARFAQQLRLNTCSLVVLSVLGPTTDTPKHVLPSFIASDTRTFAEMGIRANCRINLSSCSSLPVYVKIPSE